MTRITCNISLSICGPNALKWNNIKWNKRSPEKALIPDYHDFKIPHDKTVFSLASIVIHKGACIFVLKSI